ncbi:heavy metal-associated isoprenylated plant protein 35-like [Lolium rigidum]|uniref:heavy metal-associated isoprenylated plant protein 35-like n=1 Tax=Lolium rigidum TaxID=89674 RepID=UPI001F5CCEAC|nr:heavy metal-associated isoprenylated plant protein 35-like [Lolium rigidum]
MATEPLQCKILVLRVPIHCEGCKKKVKRVLQSVDGVYRCDIDARSNKVTVAVTGSVGGDALVKRLRRSGKNAEEWPEPQQQQQQPADSTQRSQTPEETKKQATEPDKPGGSGTAEKPASGDAEANSAEQSNPKASSEATAGVTATLAQDGTESTSADADGAVEHATKEATAEQCSDAKRNRKQQPEEVEKPVDTMVVLTAASAQSSDACNLAPPLEQPSVHVLSYSMARPTVSAASYYAAAPAARAPPPQELPYTYPPCCYYPQPSPYHGSWAPQTGAASPAYDSYSDLFSDDNANSCIVM